MKRFTLKNKIVAGAAATALALGAGAAFAAWSTSGSGSGNAKALTNVSSTVTAVTGAADLYPGSTGAVRFTVNNPNPYNVTFTGYSISNLQVVSSPGTCVAGTDVTINSATGSMSLPVTAGASATAGSIPAAIAMDHGAGDGCQGAVFSVDVSLTGAQA